MRDIRNHHNNDEITVLTTPGYAQLFSRCPWIDSIILDHRHPWHRLGKILALKRVLQRTRYMRIYDLQQVDRTRIYYHLFFRGTNWMGDARGCSCYLSRKATSCAADHLAEHLTLQGLEKRWPHFSELAERIMHRGHLPVTVPGPGEMDLCRSIPGITITNDGNCLDIFQLAGVLSQAQFVVGNDTGPTHMAAHLNRPGLALFGQHTSASSTGIQHTRFSWLEKADLSLLPVDEVWPEIDRLCRRIAKGGFRLCKEVRHQRKRVP